jgi:hypothetical protein
MAPAEIKKKDGIQEGFHWRNNSTSPKPKLFTLESVQTFISTCLTFVTQSGGAPFYPAFLLRASYTRRVLENACREGT